MHALELLLNRASQPRLQAPAPQGEALDKILQAAMRAPDHRGLGPWRFIVCEDKGLDRLGDIFEQAAIENGADQAVVDRAIQLPKRAPMVIVGICKYKENDSVPWVEQVASTSCAIYAMQLAANAQGFECIWRTGSYAQDDVVKKELSLKVEDEIVGFLYVGTSKLDTTPKTKKSAEDFVEFWR